MGSAATRSTLALRGASAILDRMKLSDTADTGRLDSAVRKTVEAYLGDLGETDLAVHLEQPPSPATPAIPYGVFLAIDSGLFAFSYSLEGGSCEVAGTLTPWREVRVSELTIRTDWQSHMGADIPRIWTLRLSAPDLALTAPRDDNDELITFARVCLERTATS